jgi:putative flippase GtrA
MVLRADEICAFRPGLIVEFNAGSTGWKLQLLRFLLVGVLNTLVGLATIWALIGIAGWGDFQANFTGYLAGLVCSFVLNRQWTFDHAGPWRPALLRFLIVFAVSYCVNWLAVLVLRDFFEVNRYLAHSLAMLPYTVTFFIGSRLFAFASQRQA